MVLKTKLSLTMGLMMWVSLALAEEPQIMMMSAFHFENPGLDLVKTEVMDVRSHVSQAYLEALSKRVAAFEPDAVMLEFDPADTAEINREFQEYVQGRFELPVNEVYQIGFRVAKLAGVQELVSLDERSVSWKADAMFKYMADKAPETQQLLNQKVAEITAQMNRDQQNMDLAALMKKINDPEQEQENKAFYLFTNPVGVNDGFAGADAAASWWHRNFRIYAKIQHQAKTKHRIFALAGQGHVAILRDLAEIDPALEAVDVLGYLGTD